MTDTEVMFDTAEEIQRYGRHIVYRSHSRYSKQIQRSYFIQQRRKRDMVDIYRSHSRYSKDTDVIFDTAEKIQRCSRHMKLYSIQSTDTEVIFDIEEEI
jgi:hypothetical protein